MSSLRRLLAALHENSRKEVKIFALQEILGFTANKDLRYLLDGPELGELLTEFLKDENETIGKKACLSLINISASDRGARYLANEYSTYKEELFNNLLSHALNPDSCLANAACMTLANLTRMCDIAEIFVDYMNRAEVKLESLINAFVKIDHNTKGCDLHYLGALFSNLTQVCEFRRQLMDRNKYFLQKLLPFTQYQLSVIRRSQIVAAVKNCCFETSYHQWLLGPEVDILPYLLLPLAGSEEFSEEDNEKLPVELQYLSDKEREDDTGVRKMLLESLHQLCATKFGREYLRAKNTYIILREYHKWEDKPLLLSACESVVNILLRTEEEIGQDNLKDVKIPEEYLKKFDEMDN